MELSERIKELRKWQRHWLLRQYGDNGQVLIENLELSAHLDAVIEAAEQPDDTRG